MKPGQIKALRKQLGLTQSALAEILGVNRMAVTHWECGIRKPSRMAVRFMELLLKLHEQGFVKHGDGK
jgi:DNA-binding transcriptional regulator YiaG